VFVTSVKIGLMAAQECHEFPNFPCRLSSSARAGGRHVSSVRATREMIVRPAWEMCDLTHTRTNAFGFAIKVRH
jgi:hypothetical protein